MRRFLSVSVRALSIMAAVLFVFAAFAGSASAHARLKTSDPADGAKLTSEPTTVTGVFGEETSLTESTFTAWYQKDAASAQTQADNGDGKVDVNDRTKMSLTLKPGLGDGIYTVKWHTLTEDDNGMADGTFTFTVGDVAAPTTGTAPAGTGVPATGQPETFMPWLALLALAVLIGGAGLRRLALR
jgi:copper transport protein